MIKLEKILGVTVLIALIFKFALIPGGSFLLVLSLFILSCLYYPMGFALLNQIAFTKILKKDSYKGLTAFKIIGSIGAGMAFSVVCLGILFKVQHWAGANTYLITGLVSILIVLAIALVKYYKAKQEFYIGILKRIAIIGALGLVFSFISELTIVKIQFRNHPNYVKAYEMYLDNPQNEELRQNLHIEDLRTKMSEQEVELYLKWEEKK